MRVIDAGQARHLYFQVSILFFLTLGYLNNAAYAGVRLRLGVLTVKFVKFSFISLTAYFIDSAVDLWVVPCTLRKFVEHRISTYRF